MNRPSLESRWLTPGTLFGALGMIGAFGGAWMSFDNRITKVESQYEAASKQYDINAARLDRIEDKLDRLIERGK